MTDYIAIEDLSDDMAKEELTRLANLLGEANLAYHGDDSPIMTDAEFDFLKKGAQEAAELYRRNGRLLSFAIFRGCHHDYHLNFSHPRADSWFDTFA